ncbi:MAG: Spi family protease inhibitor, partial [Bacteroidales bacterium]|nr:Spi family protease inhibitor [Bacteroidales bacterium]
MLVLFTIVLSLSCSQKEEYIPCFSGEKEETEISIIPIEDALTNLNHFLAEVNMLETKSGSVRTVSTIEPHYSEDILTKAGEPVPDAYLVNFKDDEGFAVLGAITSITPIIAAVEAGNSNWNKLLSPTEDLKAFDDGNGEKEGTCEENNEEEEEWDGPEYECLGIGMNPEQLVSLCVSTALKGRIIRRDGADLEIVENELPVTDSDTGTKEVLPLLSKGLYFSQNVTYCHKGKNTFV